MLPFHYNFLGLSTQSQRSEAGVENGYIAVAQVARQLGYVMSKRLPYIIQKDHVS